MTIDVTPTTKRPTHHVSLTDGSTTIGLILCDRGGGPTNLGIRQAGTPNRTLKISQGNQGYADFEPPYTPLTQVEWLGGRGAEDFEKDTTKYYDSLNVDTTKGDVILGPLVTSSSTIENGTVRFFEYQEQLYAVNTPFNTANSKLYVNGYKGLAKVNTGHLEYIDTGLTLTVNALTGCIIKVIAGTEVEKEQSWRKIVSNTVDGKCTVDVPWYLLHEADTIYVVLGSDVWTAVHTFTGQVSSICVADNIVYFAMGSSTNMIRMIEYNANGTWTRTLLADGTNKADLLSYGVEESGIRIVWKTLNNIAEAKRAVAPDSGIMYQSTGGSSGWGATTSGSMVFANTTICGSRNSKIMNMTLYGDKQLPTIIKEDEFGQITRVETGSVSTGSGTGTNVQSGTNTTTTSHSTGTSTNTTTNTSVETYGYIYAPIPIKELRFVRDERNGKATTQYGVYLYFSLLDGIERYYEQQLDDIGMNRDEGLPPLRQGVVNNLVGYAGKLLATVDTGVGTSSSQKTSGLFAYNGTGWHELYTTSDKARITGLTIQMLPGLTDRIWISELSYAGVQTLKRMPISIDARKDSAYTYSSTGTLTSAWMYASLKDIIKYFHEFTLFTENLDEGHVEITASYQLDNPNNPWIAITEDYIESPIDTHLLTTEYNASGRRLRYKLSLSSDDNLKTPRITAVVVNAVTRFPNKNSWTMTFLAEDFTFDLWEKRTNATAADLTAQLNTWANSRESPTPLLMKSNFELFDNKRVFIDPVNLQPIKAIITSDQGSRGQISLIGTLNVYEA